MNHSKKSINKAANPATASDRTLNLSDQFTKLHKFTRNTQREFDKAIKKIAAAKKSKTLPSDYLSIMDTYYRGRIVCRQIDCFHIAVSEGLVNRAIQFLDTLIKELEIRAFKIQTFVDRSGNFIAAVKDNESISFQISEGYKYHTITKDLNLMSELERLLYRDKEPIPTGKLTFSVLAREKHIGKNWADGINKSIEDDLPSIINEFNSLVLRQKQGRVDDAIKDKIREEEMRIFRANESKKYLEMEIYDTAMQEAQSFSAYRELESYLNIIELGYLEEHGSLSVTAQSWLSIARKTAQSQNPISKRLKLLDNL